MALKKITSLQNSLVKHWLKLRTDKNYRYENRTVLITGKKMVDEAQGIKTIISTDTVTEEILKKITGLEQPESIAAEVEMPPFIPLNNKSKILVLDGVSDPGNMGTLIRTALALGWEGVFILNNSCDPYNDKAIRAAKGATFRIPLYLGSWDELKKLITTNNLIPLAADIEGESIKTYSPPSKMVLVLGNEANGLSSEAKQICTRVTIPMSDKMESLNVSVAGAILIYALDKKFNI